MDIATNMVKNNVKKGRFHPHASAVHRTINCPEKEN